MTWNYDDFGDMVINPQRGDLGGAGRRGTSSRLGRGQMAGFVEGFFFKKKYGALLKVAF